MADKKGRKFPQVITDKISKVVKTSKNKLDGVLDKKEEIHDSKEDSFQHDQMVTQNNKEKTSDKESVEEHENFAHHEIFDQDFLENSVKSLEKSVKEKLGKKNKEISPQFELLIKNIHQKEASVRSMKADYENSLNLKNDEVLSFQEMIKSYLYRIIFYKIAEKMMIGKMSNSQCRIVSLEQQKIKNQTKIQSLLEEMTELVNNHETILRDKNDTIGSLERTVLSNKINTERLTKEIIEARQKNSLQKSSIKEEREQHERRITWLHNQIKISKKKNANQTEIQSLQKKLTEMKNNYEAILRSKDDSINSLEQTLLSNQKNIEHLTKEVAKAKQENSVQVTNNKREGEHKQQIIRLESRIKALEKNNKCLKDSFSAADRNVQVQVQVILSYRDQIKKKDQSLKRNEDELASLRNTVEVAEGKYKDAMTNRNDEISSLQKSIEEKNKQIQQVEMSLLEAAKNRDEKDKIIESLQKQLASNEEKISLEIIKAMNERDITSYIETPFIPTGDALSLLKTSVKFKVLKENYLSIQTELQLETKRKLSLLDTIKRKDEKIKLLARQVNGGEDIDDSIFYDVLPRIHLIKYMADTIAYDSVNNSLVVCEAQPCDRGFKILFLDFETLEAKKDLPEIELDKINNFVDDMGIMENKDRDIVVCGHNKRLGGFIEIHSVFPQNKKFIAYDVNPKFPFGSHFRMSLFHSNTHGCDLIIVTSHQSSSLLIVRFEGFQSAAKSPVFFLENQVEPNTWAVTSCFDACTNANDLFVLSLRRYPTQAGYISLDLLSIDFIAISRYQSSISGLHGIGIVQHMIYLKSTQQVIICDKGKKKIKVFDVRFKKNIMDIIERPELTIKCDYVPRKMVLNEKENILCVLGESQKHVYRYKLFTSSM